MRLLLIGDVVGQPGRHALYLALRDIVREEGVDFTVANGENAAGGFGITPKIASALYSYGIDVLTTGNHVWRNADVFRVIDQEKRLLRPANFPEGAPGRGWGLYEKGGVKVGVVNAIGRVFMEPYDCPFKAAKTAARELKKQGAQVLVLDFHAEATSEKYALGHYLDGEYSLVFGTHTHVQTSDARLLPGGTAYLTDLGMTGATDSVIGVRKDKALKKFVTGMPAKFEIAEGDVEINGAVCEVDPATGKAAWIRAFRRKVETDGHPGDHLD